jgi:hypothetical protein
MDIIPFESLTIGSPDEPVSNRESIYHVDDEASWCLFSIEIRNTCGLPFEVTFHHGQGMFILFHPHPDGQLIFLVQEVR